MSVCRRVCRCDIKARAWAVEELRGISIQEEEEEALAQFWFETSAFPS